ncbi:hypothetical protein KUF71_010271 [Frankliniella fusca]|uniref:Uncharacterized protein n=1 Tax=Frankliniella fusca TaxID=407009 RepID=A0AAE1HGQ9_9NEOP|nr:hypothetical protein KUF71_010271 [Frankliniella fusca]
MAGNVFVVCVPTRDQEKKLLDQETTATGTRLKSASIASNLENVPAGSNSAGVRLGSTRSISEESVLVAAGRDGLEQQENFSSRREMFIGPWRVDAADLPPPTTPPPPGRRGPRSPLVDMTNLSRSDPEGIRAKSCDTPVSNFKKRRHRYLEDELQKILKDLKVKNDVWCVGREGRIQVLFTIESPEACEEALQKLAGSGIGVLLNSVVSVLPCTLFYQGAKSSAGSTENLVAEKEDNAEEEYPGVTQSGGAGLKPPQTEWEKFVQSVRARLTVAEVVEGVRANAVFTFDFLLLLIVASLVAAVGLVEDSTVILVASMLISPLMGPVMAATFGTMINDRSLKRMGLVNECVGLLICLSIGLLTGLGLGFLDRPVPTTEMVDRGQLRSLWVNIVIAVLSGAGIAIALLRDNTGSLVGVAISASLMPPAVNAGLLWAMAFVFFMTDHLSSDDEDIEAVPMYTAYYSPSPYIEMAVMGGISLCITFINIVFIYITGIIMLKVKEVAPNCQAHQLFWRHDVKIARDYNTTLYGASAAEILRSVVKTDQCMLGGEDRGPGNKLSLSPELARLLHLSAAAGLPPTRFTAGGNYLRPEPGPDHQLTWSPNMQASRDDVSSTVRELQELYRTIRQHRVPYGAGAGPGHTRRSSFSSGCGGAGATLNVPSWMLGSSDGCRCIRAARGVACTGGGCVGGGPGGLSQAEHRARTVLSPPYSNMPARPLEHPQAQMQAAATPVTHTPAVTCSSTVTWAPSVTCTPAATWSPSVTCTPAATWSPSVTCTPAATWSPSVTCTPAASWSPSVACTPAASWSPTTPVTTFMTPLPSQRGPDSAVTPACYFRTPATLDGDGHPDDDPAGAGAGAAAHTAHRSRPPKRRRFVVTKAEDSESLLPPV